MKDLKELDVEKFYKNSVEVLFVMNKMVSGLQFASENQDELSRLYTVRQALELVTDIFGKQLSEMKEQIENV